jgi:CspA family cold shock protein
MATGTFKWFNGAKRFGFITRNDSGADVFVQFSALTAGYRTPGEKRRLALRDSQAAAAGQAENIRPL